VVTRNYSSWQWFVRTTAEVTGTAPSVVDGGQPPGVPELRRRVATARRALTKALGTLPQRVPLNVEILESVDRGPYRQDHIVYDSERWMSVPAYLLVPHDRVASGRPGPAVLAQHGHGAGKAEVCGLAGGDEGSEANDYAHQLATRGYVVLAPDLRTFGERADWEPPNIYSCDHSYMYASLLGYQLLALDLWDLARGLDVLRDHPLVDARRIGMVGLSQGGTCTLFLTAWDRRVRAAVVSGYLSRWEACATIGWNMCGSQVLNGVAAHLDHRELGALVAPRPLLVETGTGDNIFPVDAARATMADLGQVYAALGASDRLEHDVFEGGHRWHGERAYPFLARWLGDDEARYLTPMS
jgi:dienelactone hydrolase